LRLDRGHPGAGFGGGTGARLGEFGGNRVAAAQALAALGFGLAAGGGGAGLLQLGFKLAYLSLERARIDLEQQVAFLDLGTFGEGYLVDLAGHARAYFDGFGGFEAAGELVPFVDGLLQHLGHRDFRRTGRLRGLRGTTTGTHHHQCQGSKGIAQGFE
jgi:hypothetical protein